MQRLPGRPGLGSIPACAGEPYHRLAARLHGQVYPRVCGGTGMTGTPCARAAGLSPRVRGNHTLLVIAPPDTRSIPACAGEPLMPAPGPARKGVYPRVCGGTDLRKSPRIRAGGLSPRVRGNRIIDANGQISIWSIPACAGEPGCHCRPAGSAGVYPRVCGGTGMTGTPCARAAGLSPRVRGNRCAAITWDRAAGSIPACAGEPKRRQIRVIGGQVYPRVCGGTLAPLRDTMAPEGLSPRVRGNLQEGQTAAAKAGSIPACAGEPLPREDHRNRSEVYPRVCGGTKASLYAAQAAAGLSPRVRGNLKCSACRIALPGSIPACAGEPNRRRTQHRGMEVYPRVCGGTILPSQAQGRRCGLSPRVRGNPHPVAGYQPRRGSIPACAGEPAGWSGRRRLRGVYPRVCGGTWAASMAALSALGLSPRVRGNPAGVGVGVGASRSIPACAGEPRESGG